MSIELTRILAEFTVETSANTIPELAWERAAKCVVDTIGCILAGSGSEEAEPLLHYLAGRSGPCPIIGTSLGAQPEQAALVNGTFGHALDFDDTLSMMPAHPSTVVLPALFALMDEQISGKALLEAYIVGVEVGAKLGLGMANGHYRRGFHATGTLAIFSAISALGRLRRLDVPRLRTAFGIGASMASGVRCNFGTMTKPFHAGWAAHNAVVAVCLAECGMTSNPASLEVKAGFFDAYGTEQSNMARCAEALGKPWVFVSPGLALKKYPCIYALHRPIDALIALRAELGLTVENAELVECRMAPGVFRPLLPHLPETGLQGKFSMDYVLAVAAVDGRYDLAAFSDEAVARPGIKAMYPRVRKFEDPRCLGDEADPLARSAGTLGFAEVTVRRRDGATRTMRVDKPSGSPEKELGWDELRTKFLDCGRQVGLSEEAALARFVTWSRPQEIASVPLQLALLAKG